MMQACCCFIVFYCVWKRTLWRELSAEAEGNRRAGKYDRLAEIIREVRADARKA